MFIYPSDYFVHLASEMYKGSFNSNAFYPTPSHVVQLMVDMVYDKTDWERNKYKSVYEPCMGSGIMLLYQSNHSLRLYGQDVDLLMCKIATLNGCFYMPWLVEMDSETEKMLAKMHDGVGNVPLKVFEKRINEILARTSKPINIYVG